MRGEVRLVLLTFYVTADSAQFVQRTINLALRGEVLLCTQYPTDSNRQVVHADKPI